MLPLCGALTIGIVTSFRVAARAATKPSFLVCTSFTPSPPPPLLLPYRHLHKLPLLLLSAVVGSRLKRNRYRCDRATVAIIANRLSIYIVHNCKLATTFNFIRSVSHYLLIDSVAFAAVLQTSIRPCRSLQQFTAPISPTRRLLHTHIHIHICKQASEHTHTEKRRHCHLSHVCNNKG